MQSKNEIRNARKQKSTQPILYPSCAAVFVCVHCIFLICVAWPACVASIALRTSAWKQTFKSIFVGLRAVSKLSYTKHATQPTHGLRRNQKTEKRNACMQKQRTQSMLFLRFLCACIAVLFICVAWPACVASVALRVAAWKPTFKSVFIGLRAVSKLS